VVNAAFRGGRGGIGGRETLRERSGGDSHGTGAEDLREGRTAGELSFHGIGDFYE
jgi:hypothetical protein